MIARIAAICCSAFLLAGCVTTGPASVKGGECRIFERPQYAVRGLRSYDQDWIDGNVEAGVGGCGWKRPATRPESFDAAPGQKVRPDPLKKRSLIKRIKDQVTRPFTAPSTPPIVEVPPPIVVTAPPPATPRDPVDELLQPNVR